ncbi:MAG TPA: phosphate ABC transporter permease subunit PstC [Limnochordales bacterium]
MKTAARRAGRSAGWLYGPAGDRLFGAVVLLLGLAVVAAAALTVSMLYRGGAPALRRFGWVGFASGAAWDPAVGMQFGALPFLAGTLITSAGALLLAVFPAVATALFVTEYAPRPVAQVVSYLTDLLAAIPSVVYGLWGLLVMVPWVRRLEVAIFTWAAAHAPWMVPVLGAPTGIGVLSAILLLSVMIVPFASSVARDAIRLVPAAQREAAWALGATHWETIRMAVLPHARGGILAGVVLALGRALGETMAVTMVIGNSHEIPAALFAPGATMASVIANEFTEAVEDLHLSSLVAVGFYLFLLSLAVNVAATLWLRRLYPRGERR